MEHDFLRYSCQIALPGFSERSQLLLQNAKVLIAGAGGLGCPSSQYLAAAGIGTIGIADFDVVSEGNLHRQILFDQKDVGSKKASIASERLKKQNPGIKITALDMRIDSENVMQLIEEYDIIVDGTDNFETKYLLNDACVIAGKPLVHGAIYQYEGQLAVWNVKNADGKFSPNFRDIFPEVDAMQVPNCAEGGVIPTLAGIIGCMQANEVIKYITGSPELLVGKLLIFNAVHMQTRTINLGTVSNIHIDSLQKTESVPMMSVKELKNKMQEKKIELIDIRTIQERDQFDIGGKHLPLESFDIQAFGKLSSGPTVLYCASGKRSKELVRNIMHTFPSLEVYSLEGGLKGWKEEQSH